MQKLTDKTIEELKLKAVEEAAVINDEHATLLEDCKVSQHRASVARDRAIRIGAELMKVKKAVGHGHFMAWVELHCVFKRQTAQNYMAFAKNCHDGNLPDDLSLRQAMIALDIVPSRPREGGDTFRGGGVPSVYDPLNKLTRLLDDANDNSTLQPWESDASEREAVQRAYKPKLEEFIRRLFGIEISLPASEA